MRPLTRSSTPRSNLELPTGFVIVRVSDALSRSFSSKLAALKLTPKQLHVLRYLDASGAISHSELADRISVDRANLVETLDVLEARRLIRRQVDPNDKRRRRISLVPAGTRKLPRNQKRPVGTSKATVARVAHRCSHGWASSERRKIGCPWGGQPPDES